MLVVLLSPLFLLISTDVTAFKEKIYNGRNVKIKDFPFFASIRIKSSKTAICSGTILNEEFILTAAHCGFPISKKSPSSVTMLYDVVVGIDTIKGNNGQHRSITQFVYHRDYNEAFGTIDNDIALVKVSPKLKFSNRVRPVLGIANVSEGSRVSEIGWNRFKEVQKLQIVDQKVLNVDKFHIMAEVLKKGAGGCFGDSGGPLFDTKSKKLVGIDSYQQDRHTLKQESECAYASFYTNVAAYQNWINDFLATSKKFKARGEFKY